MSDASILSGVGRGYGRRLALIAVVLGRDCGGLVDSIITHSQIDVS